MRGCIIQARMGSNRLPGKVMEFLDDENPSLYYSITQIKNVKKVDKIIVATTQQKEDDVIYNFSERMNVECFRGSSDDVLDRYYKCAQENKLNEIIRITADCPLIDPQIIDEMITEFENSNCDYIQNLEPRTFPDGMDIEIFGFDILKRAWENAKLPSEREHVTAYFRNNKKEIRIKNFSCKEDLSFHRWTLDYSEDLELLKIIVKKIDQRPILMENILSLFTKEPTLIEINGKYEANYGYKVSLEKDKEFLENK